MVAFVASGSIAETPKAETTWRVHVVLAASAVICAMLIARSFDLQLDHFLPNEMVSNPVFRLAAVAVSYHLALASVGSSAYYERH